MGGFGGGGDALLHQLGYVVEVAPAERAPVGGLEPGGLCDSARLQFVHCDAAFAIRALYFRHVTRVSTPFT